MIRYILIALLALFLGLGSASPGFSKKGGSGHSGSGGRHESRHSEFDDSGHRGGSRVIGGQRLFFDDQGRHHHGNGLFVHNHGDGDNNHHHGEFEVERHGTGEIEIHHSGGDD